MASEWVKGSEWEGGGGGERGREKGERNQSAGECKARRMNRVEKRQPGA